MKALLGSCVLLLASNAVEARTLYWSSLEVSARLDADGALHVSERQTMVFSGDWNGGERTFDVRPGQRLRFHGISRIAENGERVRLPRGSLDFVDQWDWESRHLLRWRSRRPEDPPFDNQTLTYVLEYTLERILRPDGETYRLDHDFAFPDRPGVIERFALDLELDPVWRPPPGFRTRLELSDLAPGRGVVVTTDLLHTGPSRPAAVDQPVADHQVHALFLAVALISAFKAWDLARREAVLGKFTRPEVPDPIHRGWLQEHLFDLAPEEAGALWDQRVGAPEVAAVIARMVAEGKLASRVRESGRWWRRPTLELDLAVERSELEGYERELADEIFFEGRTRVDTEELREHHSSTGFDPASIIRPGITERLRRLPGGEERLPAPDWRPTALLLAVFAGGLAGEAVTRGMAVLGPLVAALAVAAALPVFFAYLAAAAYRKQVRRALTGWVLFLVPLALLVFVCWAIGWSGAGGRELFTDLRPGIFGLIALGAFALMVVNSVLNVARTRERKAVVSRRQLLGIARRHLARQLESPIPDLDDGWFPYILAFGLSKQVDAWSKTHGPASSSAHATTTRWTGSGRPSWTGGGEAFGAVGASNTWVEAANGMAAGVSPPSSSGGSGGGGGGGSSGGGGGGGW